MAHMGALYQITSPRFVAGLIVKQGKVSQTAPVIKWLAGMTVTELAQAVKAKDWKIQRVAASVDQEYAASLEKPA